MDEAAPSPGLRGARRGAAATARFLVRILMKMLRLKVAAAFASWIGDVALLKSRKNAHKASVLRLRRVARRMARCLSSWLKRIQLRAFRTWVDLLSREVSKLYATKHVAFVMMRWRLRRVSKALRAWRYTTGSHYSRSTLSCCGADPWGEARILL